MKLVFLILCFSLSAQASDYVCKNIDFDKFGEIRFQSIDAWGTAIDEAKGDKIKLLLTDQTSIINFTADDKLEFKTKIHRHPDFWMSAFLKSGEKMDHFLTIAGHSTTENMIIGDGYLNLLTWAKTAKDGDRTSMNIHIICKRQ